MYVTEEILCPLFAWTTLIWAQDMVLHTSGTTGDPKPIV